MPEGTFMNLAGNFPIVENTAADSKIPDRFRDPHVFIQLVHDRSLGVKNQVERAHHTMTLPNSTAPVK